MKKRSFLFTSGLALALLLTACGGSTSSSSSSSKAESKSSEPQSSVVSSSSKQESSPAPISSSVQPISSSESTPSSQQSSQQSTGQQSSNNSSGQSSSSQEVATTVYYALYDGREIALEAESAIEEIAGLEAVYRGNLGNITKGKSISILNSDKQPLSESFNAEDGDNNVTEQDGDYVIHNDATNAFVLVKIWDTPWTNFYVSGYVEPVTPEPVYKVVGTIGEEDKWSYQNGIVFEDITEDEHPTYVKKLKATFDVTANNQFKVSDGNDAWFGADKLEGNEYFESGDNSNIKAKAAGTVELMFVILENDFSIMINFTPSVEPVPIKTYKLISIAGSQQTDYEDSKVVLVDAPDQEYDLQVKTTFHVVKDYKFAVSDGTNAYAEGFASNSADSFEYNEGYIKAKAYGTVQLFLKFKNNNASMWLSFTPEYRVVGSFNGENRWSYESGSLFVDDTKEGEGYISQVKATFDVNKNDEFRITDGNEWISPDAFEANPAFTKLEGGNIKSNAVGSVTLYLKTYETYKSVAIVLETTKATVNLRVDKPGVPEDKSVYLLGSYCNWDITSENVVKFIQGESSIWYATIEINLYQNFEYKLALALTDNPTEIANEDWEGGSSNYVIYVEEAKTEILTWH